MKVIIQRVNSAAVTINGGETRSTGRGLMCLFCACEGDTVALADKLAEKTARLRIFPDAQGKMNISADELRLDCLVVSNFTLAADTRKGLRPSFIGAAKPPFATEAYERYVSALKGFSFSKVLTGEFGADMEINMACDGPVTVILDTKEWDR